MTKSELAKLNKPRLWHRKLWGVEFGSPLSERHLLGSLWHETFRHGKLAGQGYPGEPTHALLFTTRKLARDWCREQHDKNRGRGDCCTDWRFRPVPVIETVRRVKYA